MVSSVIMLLAIYGLVVGGHGCIYIDTHNFTLAQIHPSPKQMTIALRPGGNLLGMSYDKNEKQPYVILKFDVQNGDYCLIYLAKCTINNPLRLAIYVSEDGKNWKLVKTEIATTGKHSVLLPSSVIPKYVKLEGVGSKFGGFGATLFDTVYLVKCKNNKYLYKIDFNNLSVYLAGMWVSLPVLVTMFFSTLFGTSYFISDIKRQFLLSSTIITVAIVLYLLFNINVFPLPFRNVYVLILDCFIFGIAVGFAFSKVFQQRS